MPAANFATRLGPREPRVSPATRFAAVMRLAARDRMPYDSRPLSSGGTAGGWDSLEEVIVSD
jgi:hypothetical protein